MSWCPVPQYLFRRRAILIVLAAVTFILAGPVQVVLFSSPGLLHESAPPALSQIGPGGALTASIFTQALLQVPGFARVDSTKVDSLVKEQRRDALTYDDAREDAISKSDLKIVAERILSLKPELEAAQRHQRDSDEDSARRFIKRKLKCPPAPERAITIRAEAGGGIGLIITQLVLLTNMALARGQVPTPYLEENFYIWFSHPDLQFEDLFRFPCTIKAPEQDVLSCQAPCQPSLTNHATWLPPQFAHRSLQWWYRQLTLSIVRPNKRLEAKLMSLSALQAFPWRRSAQLPAPGSASPPFSNLFDFEGLPKPLISLHIRKGDACSPERPPCVETGSDIITFLHRHGITHGTLLVATDGATVIDEITHALKGEHVQFKGQVVGFRGASRSWYQSFESGKRQNYEDRSSTRNFLASHETPLEAIMDLALLAQGEIHVGSLYSNFIRAALALSRRNRYGKYFSFDAEWCPFESCATGWLTPASCVKWNKQLCRWGCVLSKRNLESPSSTCGTLGRGTLCSSSCGLFTQMVQGHHATVIPSSVLMAASSEFARFVYQTSQIIARCQSSAVEPQLVQCAAVAQWLKTSSFCAPQSRILSQHLTVF